MSLFNRIFLARKIDAWANDYKIIAARTLNQVAADLIACAEGEIANVGLKDGLFSQAAFIQERVAPIVRKVAEPVAIEILEEANIALLELVKTRLSGCAGPSIAKAQKACSKVLRILLRQLCP